MSAPERIGGDRSEIDRMIERLREGKWVGSGGAGFANDVANMLFALAESEHEFACRLAATLARAERAEAELAKARELIAMMEGEQERADNLSDKLELERALTDGAHRRAKVAEALLAEAVEALRPFAIEHAWDGKTRFEIVLASQTGSIKGADLDRACAFLARIQGDSHD